MLPLIAIAALIIIAIYNGYIVLWGTSTGDDRRLYNKIWHRIGWVIRLGIVAIWLYHIYSDYDAMWRAGLIALFVGHVGYNAIINLIRGKDLDYIGSKEGGTVSWFDLRINQDVYNWIIIGELTGFLIAVI